MSWDFIKCPKCKIDLYYEFADNGGIVSHPDKYQLIANWIYHTTCWNQIEKEYWPMMDVKVNSPISKRLLELVEIQERKHVEYGFGFNKFGDIMMELLGPIEIKSSLDYNRYMTYFNMMTKMVRYGKNFKTGHADSLVDMATYACIMQELDAQAFEIPF